MLQVEITVIHMKITVLQVEITVLWVKITVFCVDFCVIGGDYCVVGEDYCVTGRDSVLQVKITVFCVKITVLQAEIIVLQVKITVLQAEITVVGGDYGAVGRYAVYLGVHLPTLPRNVLPPSSGGSKFIRNVKSVFCLMLLGMQCKERWNCSAACSFPLVRLCLQSGHTDTITVLWSVFWQKDWLL